MIFGIAKEVVLGKVLLNKDLHIRLRVTNDSIQINFSPLKLVTES